MTVDGLLLKARDLIAAGKLNDADAILEPLKSEQPLSQDVARLWCSVAMRTNRTVEALGYAAQIYAHVNGDFYKAHWAHVLGTASFVLLDLPSAQSHFSRSLNHLMALAKSGKVPPQKNEAKSRRDSNLFLSGEAESLLWSTCAQLAKQNIPAFPYAGTLLGLTRSGRLLEFDKDLDIAVWMESWEACCAELESAGWVRSSMRIDYANYRDYIHPELGITLDVCGLQREGNQRITGGFELPDFPPEYQRISVFPPFDLIQRETAFGPCWYPRQPEIILSAFYGDWRTPNPHWDTVISAQNLQNFTVLVRCYAYHRLAQNWLLGDLSKAWSYAHQVVLKDPDDTIALRSRQWIERALNRLNRPIPDWPENQKQKRVFTRMVADLFHEGHANFLKAARELGTHLTVCVVSDQRVVENKGKLPVMNQAERAAVVAACKHVDAVLTETPASVTPEYMQQHGFDVYTFACASEQERQEKRKLCASLPAEMIQELPYTPGISTSDLVARVLDGVGSKEADLKMQRS